MKRKEQYADEIIEMLERTKCGAWASNINLNTKDRVIEVCQNVVDSWSGRKFKDHCTTSPQALEQTGWIPVSERLPSDCECDWVLAQIQEDNGYLWIPRVMEYRKNIDHWCDECLGWLKDHNGAFRVVAWMPLPQPYKVESEDCN